MGVVEEEVENIRQLFTRQRRGITSIREANVRLSGATPICSGHSEISRNKYEPGETIAVIPTTVIPMRKSVPS